MTNFYFRAVASDGQIRTGAIHAESERLVAFELRRQGLTPVYVGKEARASNEIKLPSFSGGRKRDVLFFTQELSTLLSAGVPVDRALGMTAELTESASFRPIGPGRYAGVEGRTNRSPTAWPFIRTIYGAVHQHGARRRGRRLTGA